jgi:hypothetical protein
MTTIASEGKNIISLRSQVRLNTLKINRARKEQLKAQEALAKAQEDITRAQQEIAIAEERRSQAEEELKALEETTGEKHVVIFSTKGVGYDDQIQRKGKKRFVRWEGQKSHAQDYLIVDALGPVHFFQRNRKGKPFTYQGVVKKTSIQLLELGTQKKTPNTYQFELEKGVVPTGTIFSQVLRFNNKKDWHRTAAHGLGLNLEGYNSYFTRGIYETTFLQSTQTPPAEQPERRRAAQAVVPWFIAQQRAQLAAAAEEHAAAVSGLEAQLAAATEEHAAAVAGLEAQLAAATEEHAAAVSGLEVQLAAAAEESDASGADDTSESLTDETSDSEESDSCTNEVFSEEVPKQRSISKFFIFLVFGILMVYAVMNMMTKHDFWNNDHARLVNSTLEWRDWTVEWKAWFYNTTRQNKENNTIIFNTTCWGVTRHPSCLWSV